MRNIAAIMQRELMALFYSPIGYVVIAGFLGGTGVLVWLMETFEPGKPATLRDMFLFVPFLLAIFIPAISMRTLSEEYRSGTIESMMTAPVTDTQLVLGKYFATLLFCLLMIASTLIYLIVMSFYGRPDWGASFSAYVGLALIAASFAAFGTLTSAATNNQVVAWIIGAVVLLLIGGFSFLIVRVVEGFWRSVFQQINVVGRFEQFARGIITTDGLVFFLGTAVLFVFLSIKVVESRRWR